MMAKCNRILALFLLVAFLVVSLSGPLAAREPPGNDGGPNIKLLSGETSLGDDDDDGVNIFLRESLFSQLWMIFWCIWS